MCIIYYIGIAAKINKEYKYMIIKRKTVKALIHFYFNLLLVSVVSAIVIKSISNTQSTFYTICIMLEVPVGFILSRIIRKYIYYTKDYSADTIALKYDSSEFSSYCICAILVFTRIFSTISAILFVVVFIYSLDVNDLINSILMLILSVTALVVKTKFIRRVNTYE